MQPAQAVQRLDRRERLSANLGDRARTAKCYFTALLNSRL